MRHLRAIFLVFIIMVLATLACGLDFGRSKPPSGEVETATAQITKAPPTETPRPTAVATPTPQPTETPVAEAEPPPATRSSQSSSWVYSLFLRSHVRANHSSHGYATRAAFSRSHLPRYGPT